MRFDLFYGMQVRSDPNAFLRHWADRELRENIGWLRDEFAHQAKLEAIADDDGMPAVTASGGAK